RRGKRGGGGGGGGSKGMGTDEFLNKVGIGGRKKGLNLRLAQNVHQQKKPLTRLDIVEAELQAELLKRPYGDAVFEALRRTLEQEEAVVVRGGAAEGSGSLGTTTGGDDSGGGDVVTGDKVWNRAPGVSDEEEDLRLEFERVEAAARRTALWAVARGHRKELA
ncbi:unnamed protein product, partial [Ectocarpus sp. 12 AP-2014]